MILPDVSSPPALLVPQKYIMLSPDEVAEWEADPERWVGAFLGWTEQRCPTFWLPPSLLLFLLLLLLPLQHVSLSAACPLLSLQRVAGRQLVVGGAVSQPVLPLYAIGWHLAAGLGGHSKHGILSRTVWPRTIHPPINHPYTAALPAMWMWRQALMPTRLAPAVWRCW